MTTEFEELREKYHKNTNPKSVWWLFRDLLLIIILSIPGYLSNSSNWYDNWAHIFIIVINRSGRLFFGPKIFDLFSKLLPLTKEDHREEHEIHTVKMLKYMFPSLVSTKIQKDSKNQNAMNHLKEFLSVFTPILFTLFIIIFGFAFLLASEPWILASTLIITFLLRIHNLFMLIRLIFGNMEILHHITIWEFTSDENKKLTAQFLIRENLFLIILIPGLSLDLAPFLLCIVIYSYSSTYPENYYQLLSKVEKIWNRLIAILSLAPYTILLILKFLWANSFDSAISLLYPSGRSTRFGFEYFHLILGLVLIVLTIVSWNRFIRGHFKCSDDFDSQPLLLQQNLGKNENWGLEKALRYLLAGCFLLSLIDFGHLLTAGAEGILHPSVYEAMITSGLLFLFTYFLFRGFFIYLNKIATTSKELTHIMLPYIWKHKIKEIKLHFWEAWHAPMVLLFGIGSGIYTCTMFPSPDVLRFSIMGILYQDSLYLTFFWFTLVRFALGFVIGSVLFISFFVPHYIWHILALTTIPKEKIAPLQSLPMLHQFKLDLQSLYAIGFVFLTFMVAFLILSDIMAVFMSIYVGFNFVLNIILSDRYFHRFMAPLEKRTEEEIEIDFLLYPKKKTQPEIVNSS